MTLTPSVRLRFWLALGVTALLTSCVMVVRAWGQPRYLSFGDALFAMHKTTVWRNSFNPQLPFTAHGGYHPEIPITVEHHGYDERYSMVLNGSGVVATSAIGQPLTAAGTVTNPGTYPADGSFMVDLYRGTAVADVSKQGGVIGGASSVQKADSAALKIDPPLAPGGSTSWSTTFATPADGSTYSVIVYRHVQGALVGERHINLNAECHDKIVVKYGLPVNYVFSSTDDSDAQYVASTNGGDTPVHDAEIAPLCAEPEPAPTGSPTPAPTPPMICTCAGPGNAREPVGCRLPLYSLPSCGPAPTPTPTPPAPAKCCTCQGYSARPVPTDVLNCAKVLDDVPRGNPKWGPVRDGCAATVKRWLDANATGLFVPNADRTSGQLEECLR